MTDIGALELYLKELESERERRERNVQREQLALASVVQKITKPREVLAQPVERVELDPVHRAFVECIRGAVGDPCYAIDGQ